MHDEMQPLEPQEPTNMPSPETDHEGAMAKADLYKLAKYSMKLFKDMQDDTQLESWVQAKITKAADYIASVYHYLEYEMKFTEYGHHLDNSDTLSESQKAVLKNKLMEAKKQVANFKKQQAEKLKDKKVEEGFDEKSKEGDSFKTRTGVATKTATGVKHINTSHSDEEHAEPASKVKSRSAAEKAGDKAADKAAEKESKAYEKKHPGTVSRYKDGKKVNESDKGDMDNDGKDEPDTDEYKQNKDVAIKKAIGKKVKEGNDGNLANNAKPYDKVTKGDVVAGRLGKDEMGGKKKKVKEATDEKCEECGMIEAKCECSTNESAKPSAGMSKKAKSSLVKKAKAGKDIGKVGKSFDKVAKAAGGGEKGEKIAAAAMWKNAKKKVAEGVVDAIGDALGMDTENNLAKKSPQLQKLIALRKDPKYQSPEAKAALEKRITQQKDRVSLDKGEVVGKDGKPVDVQEIQSAVYPSRNAPATDAPATDASANYSPEKKDAIAKAKHQMAIMPSRGKEMMDKAMAMPEAVNESAELTRIKHLTQILKG
jgi:hypothetical protein